MDLLGFLIILRDFGGIFINILLLYYYFLIGFSDSNAEVVRSGGSCSKEAVTSRPSLSRVLLSLSSLAAQQRALHYILQTMQVQLCRDFIVAMYTQQVILPRS